MQSLIELSNTNGEITTTSLEIARVFEREHGDVLKSIKSLRCSQEFIDGNFSLNEYKDSIGRTLPSYIITRNGFDFLAMGFTGEKAAKYKEAYITEFSRMERELRGSSTTPETLPACIDIPNVAIQFEGALKIAQLIGLKGNQAIISANRAVQRTMGTDVLELFDHSSLPNKNPSKHYTATKLGILIADKHGDTDPDVGLSGLAVNRLLKGAGLLYKPGSSRDWELTEEGTTYGELTDVDIPGKKASEPGIKWFLSTLDFLLKFIEDEMMDQEIEEAVIKAGERVERKRKKEAKSKLALVKNTTEEVTQ